MGKKVIRASVWTWRSLLSLYSKAIVLVFAVFCVVSGLFAGVKDEKEEKKTISGKAYWSADSAVIKNVKLFIGGHIVCPVYGVGFPCTIYAVDSLVTDSLGNFETAFPEALFKNGSGELVFAQIDTNSGVERIPVAATENYFLNSNSDTNMVIYLNPIDISGVYQEKKPISVSLSKTFNGSTVSLKIGNWSGGNKYSANIIDITGKLVFSPKISQDGILSWNTERFPRGIYLINVKTDQGQLSAKIAVK